MPVTSAREAEKLTQELNNLKNPEWTTVKELVPMRYEVPVEGDHGGRTVILDFAQSVELYKKLDDSVKSTQAKMKDLHDAIQAAQLVSGEERVQVRGEYQCTIIHKAGSKKISPEKLLSNGVSPQVIAASTEVGKSSDYLSITRMKEK